MARLPSKIRIAMSNPALIGPYVGRHVSFAYALARNGRFTPAVLYVLDVLDDGDRYRTYLESNNQKRYLECDVLDFQMAIDLLDEGISRDLVVDGVREPLATETYRRELARLEAERGGLTVVEVGANIGYFALVYLAQSRADGKVIAIEPMSDNVSLLEENVRINGFEDSVECYQFAVGAETKPTTMLVSTHSNLAAISDTTSRTHHVDETTVPMRSLDDFFRENGLSLESVDVLRMDVQGYEHEVFRGMSTLLRNGNVGLAFLEIHPRYLKERNEYDEFLSLLQTAGFELAFAADGRTACLRDEKPTYSEQKLEIDSIDDLRDVEFAVEVILRRE